MRVACLLAAILCATLRMAGEEPKAIRVKLDWLNAAEMGMDGCKPQSVILSAGTSVYFQLRKRPGEPEFQITADWVEAKIRLTVAKLTKTEGGTQVEASASEILAPGETHGFHVANFMFGITATEYMADPGTKKAKPAPVEKPIHSAEH